MQFIENPIHAPKWNVQINSTFTVKNLTKIAASASPSPSPRHPFLRHIFPPEFNSSVVHMFVYVFWAMVRVHQLDLTGFHNYYTSWLNHMNSYTVNHTIIRKLSILKKMY